MTNRQRIWRRARNWVQGWQGGKSRPTPEMAYVAGWQAAMREQRKLLALNVGLCDSAAGGPASNSQSMRTAADQSSN